MPKAMKIFMQNSMWPKNNKKYAHEKKILLIYNRDNTIRCFL